MNNILNFKGCFNRAQWWQINVLLGYIFIYWYIFAQRIFYVIHPYKEVKTGSEWVEFQPTAFYDSPLDLLDAFSVSNGFSIFITTIYLGILLGVIWINITSSIKRLHDIDRKGSVWLLSFIPILGPLVIFVLNAFYPSKENPYCKKHKKNEYPVFLLFALLLQIPLIVNYINYNDIVIPLFFLNNMSLLDSMSYLIPRVLIAVLLLSFGLFLDRFTKAKLIGIISLSLYLIYDGSIFQIYHILIIKDTVLNNLAYDFIKLLSFFLTNVLIIFFAFKYYKADTKRTNNEMMAVL